ncbi:MAG: hypothetical protein SFX18_01020 [Pirellulales bacterium]|nr:hypothetical protein [Pirellulales bacterium]
MAKTDLPHGNSIFLPLFYQRAWPNFKQIGRVMQNQMRKIAHKAQIRQHRFAEFARLLAATGDVTKLSLGGRNVFRRCTSSICLAATWSEN